MDTYSVSMTHALTDDLEPEALDKFIEILGDEPSVMTRPGELGVTTHVLAEDILAAQSVVQHLIQSVASDAGVTLGDCIEAEAVEAERSAAQLEESNLPDLVSSIEVAEILGVSKQRVYQLNNDHAQFPPPIQRLGSGPIWLRATIEAFDRSWRRKPGRPRVEQALTVDDLIHLGADATLQSNVAGAAEAREKLEAVKRAVGSATPPRTI